MQTNKIEAYVGIGLLVIVVLAFILQLLLQLPKETEVKAQAQVIPAIPRDLFSASNNLNKQIQQLSTPGGVPVTIGGGEIGRDNVFSNF